MTLKNIPILYFLSTWRWFIITLKSIEVLLFSCPYLSNSQLHPSLLYKNIKLHKDLFVQLSYFLDFIIFTSFGQFHLALNFTALVFCFIHIFQYFFLMIYVLLLILVTTLFPFIYLWAKHILVGQRLEPVSTNRLIPMVTIHCREFMFL